MSSTAADSIPELTSAIARGDAAAFGTVYEEWFDRVFQMAKAASRRDESFCLDVVQETMLRAVRHLRRLPDEKALTAWLARAVMSTTIDQLRMEQRRRRHETAAVDAPERAEAAVESGPSEQVDWLRAQVAALPPADRRLLHERFELGRTLRETGTDLGLSPFAVHGRIRRVLERLRRVAKEIWT